MRRGVIVVALGLGLLVLLRTTVLRSEDDEGRVRLGAGPMSKDASAAIDAFFARYVADDGRVVRHDEGGDTVSEGQAYAMLMAVAEGDRSRFERVWKWTKANLQRPDGLLSWKWRDGKVVDDSPATDADLDAARALVIAGRTLPAPELIEEGNRMGKAVLDHETMQLGPDDDLVLLAGPWAKEDRVVNPSYVAPCTYEELDAASPDARWQRLTTSGYAMAESLMADGRLPSDWATIEAGKGELRPSGPPDDPGSPPKYGLDAARLPIRLAEACDDRGRALAAEFWPRLRGLDGGGAAIAYTLDGKRLEGGDNPLGLIASASAATAAGEKDEAQRLLSDAARLEKRHSTYYGAAWIAMGQALLRPAQGGEGR